MVDRSEWRLGRAQPPLEAQTGTLGDCAILTIKVSAECQAEFTLTRGATLVLPK